MSEPVERSRLLELAVALARVAGDTARDMRSEVLGSVEAKSSPTDLVTVADAAAEQIIVDGIRSERPADAIIGEEGASRDGTSGLTWQVDPIDGTTNFVYGLPAWSVSIAVASADHTEVGVVYNPVNDELYTATRGGGAFLNARPIQVNEQGDLALSLIGTGFSPHSGVRRVQAGIAMSVLPLIRDYRRFGSAALDLCAVACGRIDGFYETGLNIWDYAAGALMVEEAGGTYRLLPANAHHGAWLVAAPPQLVDPLQDLVEKALDDLD
ncbi:MAG: inositol monophosphatase [Acidimicrobiia bacterium]|nr:inositol monophosphatase [Acidimicrobiia bacterium]